METTVTEIGVWKRQIEIEVSTEEVRPFMDEAYRSYQKKVHIDGFRKGKVPISIIRERFGKAIQVEVTDDLVQTFFKKAIDKEKLAIVSPGKVEKISFEDGSPLRFTAEVEVEPEIQVTDYKGLKINKEVLEITKDDVKAALRALQEERAERKPVEGKAEIGHIIEGDIQALDSSGVPIIGNKWEDRSFELGAPPLGDLIKDQLVGVAAGEERHFKIVQPRKNANGKAEDQEDYYSIQVKSVKEKLLPELNDNFAQQVGDFKTISDLESHIRRSLEARVKEDAEQRFRNRLADEIVKRNNFEVPSSMVESSLDNLWKDYQKRSDRDKNISEKEFREKERPSVIWSIKWYFIWHKIAETEDITVSKEEVEEEIKKMVEASPSSEEKIRLRYRDAKRREHLKEDILEDKVIKFLTDNAKIKEVTVKSREKRKSAIVR